MKADSQARPERGRLDSSSSEGFGGAPGVGEGRGTEGVVGEGC